jgi:hypothetical protein
MTILSHCRRGQHRLIALFGRNGGQYYNFEIFMTNKVEKIRVKTGGLPDGMHVFRPKIPFWVKFGISCNGRC